MFWVARYGTVCDQQEATATITITQYSQDIWTAALWKGEPVLTGAGHAGEVLVETISTAAKSREACRESAIRKALRLGYSSPDIIERSLEDLEAAGSNYYGPGTSSGPSM